MRVKIQAIYLIAAEETVKDGKKAAKAIPALAIHHQKQSALESHFFTMAYPISKIRENSIRLGVPKRNFSKQ
jgi:hypothetical protein